VPDLVSSQGCDQPLAASHCELTAIGSELPEEQVSGEWIGLLAVRASKTARLLEHLERLAAEEPELARTASLPFLLNRMVRAGERVVVVHSWGHWRDFDAQRDLAGD
jgi:hypothetical protein